MINDPLDLAFMAIGVDAAFRDPTTGNYDGGELELVAELLAFQPLLDAHFQAYFGHEGFPGCWAYEVAEPFGDWCARQLMAGHTVDQKSINAWLDENAPGNETRSLKVVGDTPTKLGSAA
jgi:hypothetical protein